MTGVEAVYGLSPMQLGMLFQTLLAPDSGVFVEQQVVALGSNVHVPAFEQALRVLVAGTPILRTSFHWRDLEQPFQVVHREATIPVQRLDWTHITPSLQRSKLDELLRDLRQRGFEFEKPPLMWVGFVQVSPTESWFVWQFHHILLDGWSSQLVLKDLIQLYECSINGAPLIAPSRPPYSSFIEWIGRQDATRSEQFWRNRLAGFRAPTPLGIAQPNTRDGQTPPAELRIERQLTPLETSELREFARRHRLTLNTVVLGAWALLLRRYSGMNDVTFGMVHSGRPADLQGVEEMVGLFINTVPFRVQIDPDEPAVNFLKHLQLEAQEIQTYQHISTLDLQRWSELPSGTNLFDSVLVFENFPMTAVETTSGPEPISLGRTDVGFTVMVIPGTAMHFKFVVDDRLTNLGAVERMAVHFEKLVLELARSPAVSVGLLPMLTENERQQLLVTLNDTAELGYDRVPIAAMLRHWAEEIPERVAFLEDDGQTLSFGELEARSNRLANLLIDRGVTPGSSVGVHLSRSIDAVIAFYATQKARSAFLPLDPTYPAERIADMVRRSEARHVISHREPELDLGVEWLQLAALEHELASMPHRCPMPDAAPSDVAYVLFTSGSTGRPKGAVAEHRQVLNRLHWMWRTYPFATDEVGVVRTSLNFVDAFWELLGPALQGFPSVIASDNLMEDPRAFITFLARHGVTRLWLVPSYLRMMLDVEPNLGRVLPALTFWSVGGEPLTRQLYDDFCVAAPKAVLYNAYGASEFWDAIVFDPHRHPLPPHGMIVGQPIANTQVYVMNNRNDVVPVGVTGDLYVGGDCLVRGYLDDHLTAERFIPNPFSDQPSARLYDTGDLARYTNEGTIELVGRRDEQINLRGFRIEPAEVEEAIERLPAAREAAVVARRVGDSDQRLVAYVVPAGDTCDGRQLLTELAKRLPAHLVPSAVIWIDAMPRTASGKCDRQKLPAFEPELRRAAIDEQPRNAHEQAVSDLMAEVLGISRVGIHDNFFADLGGHSLLATRLISRLRNRFGVDLPIRTIFEHPTVAELAKGLPTNEGEDLDAETQQLLEEIEQMTPEEVELLLARLEHDPAGTR